MPNAYARTSLASGMNRAWALWWAPSLREGKGPGQGSTTYEGTHMFTLLDLCVSSLRRGHANLLCIVSSLMDYTRRESNTSEGRTRTGPGKGPRTRMPFSLSAARRSLPILNPWCLSLPPEAHITNLQGCKKGCTCLNALVIRKETWHRLRLVLGQKHIL